MRKYLEQEMLAPSLSGRIRYQCTTYRGMDGSHIFEIYADETCRKQFSLETVNNYFIHHGCKENTDYFGTGEYWESFWSLMDKIPMQSRTEYTDDEFCEALKQYRNQPIKDSLYSENPICRMFAILDRRLGKRTLGDCAESMDSLPDWLQSFYRLRMEAEHIL